MLSVIKLDMSENSDIGAYYAHSPANPTILSYKGPINNALIADMSNEIRVIFKDDLRVKRKLYSIFLELVQNILYYSAEVNRYAKQDRVGMIVLTELEQSYQLLAGNLIESSAMEVLQDRFVHINALDEAGLRKYRLELVEHQDNPLSKGAGIGLIKIALTAEKPIQMSFQRISDDFSFYTIVIEISK